jgi:hypothetical protein
MARGEMGSLDRLNKHRKKRRETATLKNRENSAVDVNSASATGDAIGRGA